MSSFKRKVRIGMASAILAAAVGSPVLADDIEIYRSQAASLGARPNVLFIIDTSGSMDTDVESQAVYDKSRNYGGSCSKDLVYFSLNDSLPQCDADNAFPVSSNVCAASATALGATGGGIWPALGSAREKVGQFRANSNTWKAISTRGNTGLVECAADAGLNGPSPSSTQKFIANVAGGFSILDNQLWDSAPLNAQSYRLFSGNYLNYARSDQTITQTRLQIVRDVAINLAGTLQNVNLGLMRYSSDAQGGMVLQAVKDIATNRSTIITTLNQFNPQSGDGFTPLSETLYEAALYFKGSDVDYGNRSSPTNSSNDSRQADSRDQYNSPIDYQCQKNYVVYLTDGLPTHDHDANSKAAATTMLGRQCDDPDAPQSSGWEQTDGRCTDDIADYLNTRDISSSQPGTQTVSTYMIGFGGDVSTSVGFLNDVARAGGTGRAYTAADTASLTEALQEIFNNIQKRSSTFVTPSVSINAFNRALTSDEVYFSLFQVGQGAHWDGNLKKYFNRNGRLLDDNDQDVVDSLGNFRQSARSDWSEAADPDITAGGAASRLASPDARRIYTFLGQNPLTSPSNALTTNGSLTDSLVGAGTSNTVCTTACQDTIKWARGIDVNDSNADGNKTDQRRFIGDPLHAKLGVVTYGGTTSIPDDKDSVVFVPTNDGFLHAFNAKTGEELWAFIPPELLSRLFLLKENDVATSRSYGLDGDIRVLKFDKNQDGIVDPTAGDYVRLFFGMRAGGNHYYAIDVTNRNTPELKWNIGPDQLPGVGQTWSAPVITRVKVNSGSYGNNDAQNFVLIFGGGYDPRQESQPYSADSVGNRLFMVDASTGKLLWFAGAGTSGSPSNQLVLTEMNNSIPSAVTVLDTNGDLFADRLYVGDMGGRIWRFDIFNNQPPSTLVAGGVFARLGAGGGGTNPARSTARRFYYAPDVALIRQAGRDPYYNLAIGSGYRGHPLNTETEEHFYSLRDRRPYSQMSKTDYDNLTPITNDDTGLVDITANPGNTAVSRDAKGWKLRMSAQSGRSGEKVLSQSTTFNNVVLFTTFQPTAATGTDSCFPTNVNRMYALYASSAKPALDLNGDNTVNGNDVAMTLNLKDGIAGSVVVGVNYGIGNNNGNGTGSGNNGGGSGGGSGGGTGGGTGGGNNGGGNGNNNPGGGGTAMCFVPFQYVPCPPGQGATRTFWQRKGAK